MNDGDTYNIIFDKGGPSESYASTETLPTESNTPSSVNQCIEQIHRFGLWKKNHKKSCDGACAARRRHTAPQTSSSSFTATSDPFFKAEMRASNAARASVPGPVVVPVAEPPGVGVGVVEPVAPVVPAEAVPFGFGIGVAAVSFAAALETTSASLLEYKLSFASIMQLRTRLKSLLYNNSVCNFVNVTPV